MALAHARTGSATFATKAFYLSLTATAFAFVSILLLTGVHP